MNTAPTFAGRSRQRGAVLLFAAMGISALIITASLIDLGLLYQYRREYQKTADLAALAGAQNLFNGCGSATTAANLSVTRNLGGRAFDTPVITCGVWRPNPVPVFDDSVPAAQQRAVEVTISGSPPGVLSGISSRNLTATAIAITDQPIASLTARSTLLDVDSSNSPLLNSVVGGLLGGSINLPVAAWNGLLDTDINLLSFADALALRLGLSVSDRAGLLASTVTVGDVLDVALAVMPPGGTADLALNGLLNASLPGLEDTITVGDLLFIDPQLETSGLDAALNLMQLVQASVQLGGQDRTVNVNLGLATVQLKIVEPPQISAVGNPEWASDDPFGPAQIYVRTAQVRALISVNLPGLSSVTGLVNAVLNLASPVTTLLNDVLTLDLVGALTGLVGSLVGTPYEVTDIQVVPGNPRIDISLDAGSGDGRVVGHDCDNPAQSRLTADVSTAVARLRIGRLDINPASPGYVFASATPPAVAPVPLVDVGVRTCRIFLGLIQTCEARRSFEGGGIGIQAQSDIVATQATHDFLQPPLVGEPPLYEEISSSGVVGSLASTLGGVQLQMYGPDGAGGLGGTLNLVGALFNTVKGLLEPVIAGLLSALLDPLLDLLLDTLGVSLAETEIGANLTCNGGGATLVR